MENLLNLNNHNHKKYKLLEINILNYVNLFSLNEKFLKLTSNEKDNNFRNKKQSN